MKKSIGSGRGSVYNILLKALQTGDKYGYEICKEIEEKSNGMYILKQPSLYSGLKRLEAQNLISSYWRDSDLGGRRHYYSLTESGRQKIENSTFSWEDTRNDLVDSLFEKSELEQSLDDVANDVNQLKEESEKTDNLQNDIDDIISSTQFLADKQNQSESTISQNDYQQNNDLFSMFGNFDTENKEDSNNNENEENVANNFDEMDQTILRNNLEQEEDYQQKFENNESQNYDNENVDVQVQEINDEQSNNESSSLFDYISEYEDLIDEENLNEEMFGNEDITEETQNLADKEIDCKNEQDQQLDLFSFVNNNNTEIEEVEEEQIIEENDKDNYQDIINNFTTINYSSPKGQNNEHEEETTQEFENETIEFNEDTNIEQYNSYFTEQNSQQNQNIEYSELKNETDNKVILPKSNTDFIAQYHSENISNSSFVDDVKMQSAESSNFFSNNFESDNSLFNFNFEDVQNDDKQEDYLDSTTQTFEDDISTKFNDFVSKDTNLEQTESFENIEKPEEININYENIFGDMIANNADNYVSESQILEEQSSDNLQENIEDNSIQNKKFIESTNTNISDDLPRVTPKYNDINRTLTLDQEMINEINNNYYAENPFEKFDRINNQYAEQSQNEQQNTYENEPVYFENNAEKNLPFDKKYANLMTSLDMPDYQIRYYKKQNENKHTHSKFLSINKLNLVHSFIISLIICLFTTITLVCSQSLSGVQIALYVVSYCFAFLFLIANFILYMLDKTKKISKLKNKSLLYNTFFAIIIIVLSLSINIFYGMNLHNISNYLASFILPICYAIMLFVFPALKKILSKLSYFYTD